MKFYRIALYKYYFDKGYSLASYPKWVIAVFGIGEVVNKNYGIVILGAFLFTIACFLIGRWFYKSGFAKSELEVTNKINPFVKEVRNSKIFKDKPLKKNR